MQNIIQLPSFVNEKRYFKVLRIAAIICGSLLFMKLISLKSCGNNYDVTTSARATSVGYASSFKEVGYYVDTPRVKYIHAVKLPADSLVTSIQNMRSLMNDFGVEMGGSRIKEYQQYFEQQINRILRYSLPDSIKIK